MKRLWKSFTRWLFGFTDLDLADYERRFPGRCMICSFHAYGYANGFTDDPHPPVHEHPEFPPHEDTKER
jgi:hypothetical protein